MAQKFILFDMDSVLLESHGYHQSLRTSLKRIGAALGIPNIELNQDHIARFEALSVTNEWDSIAICTALLLLEVWKIDGNARLIDLHPRQPLMNVQHPDIDHFLDQFKDVSRQPGHSAYDYLVMTNLWLTESQRQYLSEVLHHCRNIYRSPTLPGYQETVIGSQVFKELYDLEPQLHIDGFLFTLDRPLLTSVKDKHLRNWLSHPERKAGILTNRPCKAPDGYLSAPEAEIGAKIIGWNHLPIMGSSLLAWYASKKCEGDEHQLLKPHPVHALALLQMCLGVSVEEALEKSFALTQGSGARTDWDALNYVKVIVFEDSAKGLLSGKAAQIHLSKIGIQMELLLIGIAKNPIKRRALEPIAHHLLSSINEVEWNSL